MKIERGAAQQKLLWSYMGKKNRGKSSVNAEGSTANKLDSTDGSVGAFATFGDFLRKLDRGEIVINYDDPQFRAADEAAIDDERFEWDNSRSTKDLYREVKVLEGYVARGVRSVRNASIDDDTLNGLAHRAHTRTGDIWRTAWKLGRAWALANLPTFAELALRDRRFSEARERGRARKAKENWERGDILANLELFADEP